MPFSRRFFNLFWDRRFPPRGGEQALLARGKPLLFPAFSCYFIPSFTHLKAAFLSTLFIILPIVYLIGAIPTGVILTRLAGAGDVRQEGSGNIGATNVYRVAGRTLGILTLIGDTLKGALPVYYAAGPAQLDPWAVALVSATVFLGHLYPVYLGFKGGKGVATGLGVFLVLSPVAVLLALLVFAAVLWRWRYISLASICAAGSIPFLAFGLDRSLPLFAATFFVAVMVIVRHRSNIERLRHGTESRFRA